MDLSNSGDARRSHSEVVQAPAQFGSSSNMVFDLDSSNPVPSLAARASP
jgi:hypothetical protein